jgi:hypothetical protein
MPLKSRGGSERSHRQVASRQANGGREGAGGLWTLARTRRDDHRNRDKAFTETALGPLTPLDHDLERSRSARTSYQLFWPCRMGSMSSSLRQTSSGLSRPSSHLTPMSGLIRSAMSQPART